MFLKILLLVIVIVVSAFAYIRWFEWSNVYFPTRFINTTPLSLGLTYEDVNIRTKDNVDLNGWFVPATAPARGTVIFCHGNGGNIGDRMDGIKTFNELGFNVFIFDYRGYGASDGIPSEKGTYLDAEAAYRYVHDDKGLPAESVVIFGKSLGGAVAADLAAKVSSRALVVDSSFTSAPDMAGEIYPHLPSKHFMSIEYDTLSRISRVKQPVLIIHGRDDDVVPVSHGEKLFDAAPGEKELLLIRGGHETGFTEYREEFKEGVDKFLKKTGI